MSCRKATFHLFIPPPPPPLSSAAPSPPPSDRPYRRWAPLSFRPFPERHRASVGRRSHPNPRRRNLGWDSDPFDFHRGLTCLCFVWIGRYRLTLLIGPCWRREPKKDESGWMLWEADVLNIFSWCHLSSEPQLNWINMALIQVQIS
ncbi:hypothetical protein ILYODFUR_018742 [Ilyodon furcidens]|uniref:Uncharacterized protein n=1 Tax=Ilyodon furcidens TaxID=33524 RepID=A0ABV0UUB3_9TELE